MSPNDSPSGRAVPPTPKSIPSRLRAFRAFRVSVEGTEFEICGRSVYCRPKGPGTPLRRIKDRSILTKVYRAADRVVAARRSRADASAQAARATAEPVDDA